MRVASSRCACAMSAAECLRHSMLCAPRYVSPRLSIFADVISLPLLHAFLPSLPARLALLRPFSLSPIMSMLPRFRCYMPAIDVCHSAYLLTPSRQMLLLHAACSPCRHDIAAACLSPYAIISVFFRCRLCVTLMLLHTFIAIDTPVSRFFAIDVSRCHCCCHADARLLITPDFAAISLMLFRFRHAMLARHDRFSFLRQRWPFRC